MGSLSNESIYFKKRDIIARTRDPSGILYGPGKAARARQNPVPVYIKNRECQVSDELSASRRLSAVESAEPITKEAARGFARGVWAELDMRRRSGLAEQAGAFARRFLKERGASGRVFLTAPIGDEIDLLSVMSALSCDLFLPVIRNSSMDFVAYRKGQIIVPLRPGRFQIPEPQGTDIAVPDAGDLMFVPSLACNPHRFRLGRGGGFFDRYFAEHARAKKCRKVSAMPVELVEIHFPEQLHDVKLDELVTDTGTME